MFVSTVDYNARVRECLDLSLPADLIGLLLGYVVAPGVDTLAKLSATGPLRATVTAPATVIRHEETTYCSPMMSPTDGASVIVTFLREYAFNVRDMSVVAGIDEEYLSRKVDAVGQVVATLPVAGLWAFICGDDSVLLPAIGPMIVWRWHDRAIDQVRAELRATVAGAWAAQWDKKEVLGQEPLLVFGAYVRGASRSARSLRPLAGRDYWSI